MPAADMPAGACPEALAHISTHVLIRMGYNRSNGGHGVNDVRRMGLSRDEAAARLEKYGPNLLKSPKKAGAAKIFASQFKDVLVLILLASTIISVALGEYVEAITIIAIVFVNAAVGFAQEYRTEKTLEALKSMAAPGARVLRGGQIQEIAASQVVPGDVVLLDAGMRVCADGFVLESSSLATDESLLTGESIPVEKSAARADEIREGFTAQNRRDMVYMGTMTTAGHGRFLVSATGMSTQMGGIAGLLHEIPEERTPLQQKLAAMGRVISIVCIGICLVVTLTGILRGEALFDMFLTGLSLAVAAIPEGLPAVVTIALGLGTSRMLARGALIRRLHAVETLGCSDVICSDKTGTLTQNKMTVTESWSMGGAQARTMINEIAVLCNDSSSGRQSPTETAIYDMALEAGVNARALERENLRISEKPFDSSRKLMSVVVSGAHGRRQLTKGAPEVLLASCTRYLSPDGVRPLDRETRAEIERSNAAMCDRALRVIGFGYREAGGTIIESDMIFAGLAGMLDPPRPEAAEAVRRCRSAGIRPVMITGDHKNTAVAIARQLGIFGARSVCMTGAQLDALSDEQLMTQVERVSVFARVSPAHKLRIVRALRKKGHIVAMTGDGVNDAPAVTEADIGVAMGVSGSDVTKEASSVVLLDDNFSTLVAAVEEGRGIFANIRKFIRYLLSCNIGEVITMFAGMLAGLPAVLVPIQILLVNLVTDSLPAIALGMEPGEPDLMRQRPRRRSDGVFSGGLLPVIIFRGCMIGLTTLGIYSLFGRLYGELALARTAALVTLIATQLVHVFECKSETRPLTRINPFNNPFLIIAVLISAGVTAAAVYLPALRPVFGTVPLGWGQLGIIAAATLLVPLISGIFKRISMKNR